MIQNFVSSIIDYHEKSYSHKNKVIVFAYYLEKFEHREDWNADDISKCYFDVKEKPYTNIPQMLIDFTRTKPPLLLKLGSNKYILSHAGIIEAQKTAPMVIDKQPTNELLDLSLIRNTRGYLEKIFTEACRCYDEQLPTACFVMLRKGIETLIIDYFVLTGNKDEILNPITNEFYYLSDLINKLSNKVTLSRNYKSAFAYFKKYGDMSAHGKHTYNMADIDKEKDNLVDVVREMLIHNDYINKK